MSVLGYFIFVVVNSCYFLLFNRNYFVGQKEIRFSRGRES